ncbi:hypothetical protein AVEN_217283-1 [Araneus ventricosus]|uniref:Uncharacterized protein n=1 Tax=Araneus ventricosus TaxID=182803 RepID=A0A4Y2FZU2_ARAVE|nr:hypothetical protein AVEN_217283-1 [Araneus ventricosus]
MTGCTTLERGLCMGCSVKQDIHGDTVPLHLERLAPKLAINANMESENYTVVVEKFGNPADFPLGAFGHKIEIRFWKRRAMLPHKNENHKIGEEE